MLQVTIQDTCFTIPDAVALHNDLDAKLVKTLTRPHTSPPIGAENCTRLGATAHDVAGMQFVTEAC